VRNSAILIMVGIISCCAFLCNPSYAQTASNEQLGGFAKMESDIYSLNSDAQAHAKDFTNIQFPTWQVTYNDPVDINSSVTLVFTPSNAFSFTPAQFVVTAAGQIPTFTVTLTQPSALLTALKNIRRIDAQGIVRKVVQAGGIQFVPGITSCTVHATFHPTGSTKAYNLNDLKVSNPEMNITVDPPSAAQVMGVNPSDPTQEDFLRNVGDTTPVKATLKIKDEGQEYPYSVWLAFCGAATVPSETGVPVNPPLPITTATPPPAPVLIASAPAPGATSTSSDPAPATPTARYSPHSFEVGSIIHVSRDIPIPAYSTAVGFCNGDYVINVNAMPLRCSHPYLMIFLKNASPINRIFRKDTEWTVTDVRNLRQSYWHPHEAVFLSVNSETIHDIRISTAKATEGDPDEAGPAAMTDFDISSGDFLDMFGPAPNEAR